MNEELLREVLSNRSITAEAVKIAKEWVAAAWAESDRDLERRRADAKFSPATKTTPPVKESMTVQKL